MNVEKVLEYPLPVLKADTEELVLEGREINEASFSVRNAGGGTLEGRVISSARFLAFEPDTWSGNRQEIRCRILTDTEGAESGEYSAQILTNGGELLLPITVRLAKAAVSVSDITISSLQDFHGYATDFPEEAQELFAGEKFKNLLSDTGFPYIGAYTLLVKEENRPRALDNFLILAGLKKRTSLQTEQSEIEHRAFDNSLIHGEFEVTKSDNGYVEVDISTESGAEWLTLEYEGLTVKYSIDPLLIPGRYARERVIINDIFVDIVFKRPLPLLAWLPREGFTYQDEGTIVVENQTKDPLKIELVCNETFVRLYQREYKVDGQLIIPFIIKLSPLQSAQMLFRRAPSLRASIEIKAIYKGRSIGKTLTLVAGEW